MAREEGAGVSTIDIWVGSNLGVLKGISLESKKCSNYLPGHLTLSQMDKSREMCAMCWDDGSRDKFFVALRSGLVQSFSCTENRFTAECDCSGGDGAFVGIGKHEGTLITCTEKGCLTFWPQAEDKIVCSVGTNVAKMRTNPEASLQVATGGRENDLKLWDGNNLEKPVFEAKNVRNDFLDLRVPVWVTDLGFVPGTASQPVIAVGTGHHQLRLYDTRAQKRPVYSRDHGKAAITALSVAGDGRYYFVGTAVGDMARIDLRKGEVVNRYKGFSGAVLSMDTHKDDSHHLVAGCGLDRYLRVFDVDPPATCHQMYLKLQCSCVLFGNTQFAGSCDADLCKQGNERECSDAEDNAPSGDDEDEDVWAAMEPVGDTVASRPVGDTVASRPVGDTVASRPVGDTVASRPVGDTVASRPAVKKRKGLVKRAKLKMKRTKKVRVAS